MGGTIWSISRPGRWTSTLFSLPISLVTFNRMRARFYSAGKPRKITVELMRTPIAALALCLGIAPSILGAPRIVFERVLAAPHDLGGAEQLVIVQAIGDHAQVETFVQRFADQVNRSNFLQVRDVRGEREARADAELAVKTFTCQTATAEGEGSKYDVDGKRVKRRHVWVDAACFARIDVRAGKQRSSFYAKGEGTSPRVEEITDDIRKIALEQAAKYAAVSAAERITPRRVRESILLDETAPAFGEGMAMIDSNRLGDARALWQQELRKQPRSAALHYNLAAVYEALGDRNAAEHHYTTARSLAPGEARYAGELKLFRMRTLTRSAASRQR